MIGSIRRRNAQSLTSRFSNASSSRSLSFPSRYSASSSSSVSSRTRVLSSKSGILMEVSGWSEFAIGLLATEADRPGNGANHTLDADGKKILDLLHPADTQRVDLDHRHRAQVAGTLRRYLCCRWSEPRRQLWGCRKILREGALESRRVERERKLRDCGDHRRIGRDDRGTWLSSKLRRAALCRWSIGRSRRHLDEDPRRFYSRRPLETHHGVHQRTCGKSGSNHFDWQRCRRDRGDPPFHAAAARLAGFLGAALGSTVGHDPRADLELDRRRLHWIQHAEQGRHPAKELRIVNEALLESLRLDIGQPASHVLGEHVIVRERLFDGGVGMQ